MDGKIQKDCQWPILEELDVLELTELDSADSVHGMPVSLQLVGRRLEEEKLLAMTDVILKTVAL